MIKLFNPTLPNRGAKLLDPTSGILNWDDIRNKAYLELWNQMGEFMWLPTEVSMSQDGNQWGNLMSEDEKHTYKLAVGQLAVLDSVATAYDTVLALNIPDPAVKACFSFVAGMESIHNYSYTYALSSFTNAQEKIDTFETPKYNKVMLERNKLVMDLYEAYINEPTKENMLKSLVGNMILEGLYFLMGFTYFFHLARNGKMVGTQTLISLIKRDETIHAILNSYLIRDLCTEYPELNTEEFSAWVKETFKSAVKLEKAWGVELYGKDPSINLKELEGYLEWQANLLLDLIGQDSIFEQKTNPMRWITVYDTDKMNNTKTDFFEQRVTSYSKTTDAKQDWDDL